MNSLLDSGKLTQSFLTIPNNLGTLKAKPQERITNDLRGTHYVKGEYDAPWMYPPQVDGEWLSSADFAHGGVVSE